MLRPSSILTVLLLLCFGCTPSLSASNYAALYDGLNQPVAVVTDSLGYLYVVNYQPPTVIKLAPSGLGAALVTYNTTSTPSILFPTGLCLDSALNVFIVDSGNDRIIKFNNAGVQQLIIASTATNPTLLNPHSCVVDSTGNIFVSNNNGNGAIIKLSSAGTQVAIFTTSSPSLNNTNQIALDSAGSLFIADSNNNRVVKLSSAGVQQPVFTLASNRYPQGVAIDSQGSVYVSMNVVNAGVYATTLLSVFASDGSTLPILTTSIPDLSHLSGLWVDSSFNVFAADTGNSRIVKFYSAQSGFVTANPYSGLNTPSDVAVDSLGALYVVSLNGVMKLQSANSSTILQNYTITTGEPFSVNGARGLCLDTARNVYILDSYNNRVVKFSNDGMVLQIYASNSTTPALVTPFGCVADSLNFLYIYNTVTRSITLTSAGINKMAPNGSQVAFFGSTGLGSAPRSNPKLTIDSAGALLVADPNNYRIVKLDSTTGAVLQNFTMFPAYAVPITPSAVAVDQYGVVYAYAGNIFVFSPSGVLLNELGSNLLGGAGGVAVDGSGHLYATGATQIAIFQTASSITAAVPITSSSSSSSSAAPLSGGSSSSTGRSGGSVVGDPQFVGLLGQSFQVHGIDGQVYNLISDQAGKLIINACFTYLSSGVCPKRAGATNCWSHAGSYLTEMGVVAPSGERLHIGSGKAEEGFSTVSINGVPMAVGSTHQTAGLTVHYINSYTVRITVGNFELTVENSDGFVNLIAVRVLDWSQLTSHGLLGQTWRAPLTRGVDLAAVEGAVDDYAEANNELMGDGFMYKT